MRKWSLALGLVCVMGPLASHGTEVPAVLNYQGRVTIGGTNITGSGEFKFALVGVGGAETFWRNDGGSGAGEPSAAVSVPLDQGLYSVLLGQSGTPNMAPIPPQVFDNSDVHLRVWFSGEESDDFVLLAPDQRLGASGYALRAAVADRATLGEVAGDLSVGGNLSVNGGFTAAEQMTFVIDGATAWVLGPTITLTNEDTGRNVIGGFGGNSVGEDVVGATISGGGGVYFTNTVVNAVTASFGTIAGGLGNIVGAETATVSGGEQNTALGLGAVVGGGYFNLAEGVYSVAGGGFQNTVTANFATVPGGFLNAASGNFSVAMGERATAEHDGAFVWGSAGVETVSTDTNSFTVRAPGGAQFLTTSATNPLVGVFLGPGATSWAVLSDRDAKTAIESIAPREILSKLGSLPVHSWRYRHDPDRLYIGPMSQDFHAAFGLGANDKTIATIDSDGVMFGAIQGLLEELEVRDEQIQALERRLGELEERFSHQPPR